MEYPWAVSMDSNKFHILELVASIFVDVFPDGLGGDLTSVRAGRGNEGNLEHFRLDEAARGVAQHGPGDVGHAVLGLVEQLRGRAAHLHGVEHLHLDLAARLFFDLLRPRNDGLGRNGGLRREELVQTQGDLLRHRAACKECCAHQTDGAELELFHGEVSLKI